MFPFCLLCENHVHIALDVGDLFFIVIAVIVFPKTVPVGIIPVIVGPVLLVEVGIIPFKVIAAPVVGVPVVVVPVIAVPVSPVIVVPVVVDDVGVPVVVGEVGVPVVVLEVGVPVVVVPVVVVVVVALKRDTGRRLVVVPVVIAPVVLVKVGFPVVGFPVVGVPVVGVPVVVVPCRVPVVIFKVGVPVVVVPVALPVVIAHVGFPVVVVPVVVAILSIDGSTGLLKVHHFVIDSVHKLLHVLLFLLSIKAIISRIPSICLFSIIASPVFIWSRVKFKIIVFVRFSNVSEFRTQSAGVIAPSNFAQSRAIWFEDFPKDRINDVSGGC